MCVCLSVCLSVCLLPRNQLPTSFLRRKQSFIGFFMVFSTFLPFGFSSENASFKSYGVICWSPHPSSLPGKLSTAKRDSDGFFSARKVYMVSYRSNNTTGSSLIVLHWQRSFLAISACHKMLTQYYTRDTTGHYAIVLGSPLAYRMHVSICTNAVLLIACAPRVLHYSASFL